MRVLGFPVHVRRGFLFFMVLIVVLYGDEYGVWLAGSIAAFTLLHELGHAVAARRAGATAEISLDFLAGYASYTAPKPLSRGVEAAIALAGPVIQITAGFIVLAAMGVDPLDAVEPGSSPAATAVWWAGPAIGAFNLIPVLPLDGGNVVTSLLDRVLPGRARSVMVYVSLALTAAGGRRLRGQRRPPRLRVLPRSARRDAAAAAVRRARASTPPSPFDKAMAALRNGDEAQARRIATNGLRRPERNPGAAADARRLRTAPAAGRAAPPTPVRRPVERVRADEPPRRRR